MHWVLEVSTAEVPNFGKGVRGDFLWKITPELNHEQVTVNQIKKGAEHNIINGNEA